MSVYLVYKCAECGREQHKRSDLQPKEGAHWQRVQAVIVEAPSLAAHLCVTFERYEGELAMNGVLHLKRGYWKRDGQ